MLRKERNTSVGNFFSASGCFDADNVSAVGMRRLPRRTGCIQKRCSHPLMERTILPLNTIGD